MLFYLTCYFKRYMKEGFNKIALIFLKCERENSFWRSDLYIPLPQGGSELLRVRSEQNLLLVDKILFLELFI